MARGGGDRFHRGHQLPAIMGGGHDVSAEHQGDPFGAHRRLRVVTLEERSLRRGSDDAVGLALMDEVVRTGWILSPALVELALGRAQPFQAPLPAGQFLR